MKTPSYYRHKPHEIERAFLVYVPEAPRVSPDSATDWEALSDDSGVVDTGAAGDAGSKVSGLSLQHRDSPTQPNSCSPFYLFPLRNWTSRSLRP